MSNEILPLIDFSKVKKKRKQKEEDNTENKDDDLDDIVLTKKKGANNINENDLNSNGNEDKFSYEGLLKRIYNIMKVQNTNSSSGGLKLPSIQVNQTGKDRTCWMNIESVAEALNRNIDHLFEYVKSELGVEGTLGGEKQANFKSRVTQTNLQKILTKYINDYVRCPNCKSFKTIIKKDQSTRLQQISCENCKSEKTIQVIKSRTTAKKKK